VNREIAQYAPSREALRFEIFHHGLLEMPVNVDDRDGWVCSEEGLSWIGPGRVYQSTVDKLLDGFRLGHLVDHIAIPADANDGAKRTKVEAGYVVWLTVCNLVYAEQIGRCVVAC
jgi:hypothetical protein